MAYSGRLTCQNFKDAFSQFVRFICDDPNTPGRDWEIVFTELDTSSGNFSYIQYSGSINVEQLNVWYYLPTVFVTEYTFSVNGTTLQEGTDYTLDWKLGKVKFLTGNPPYTVNYNYKFKRYRFVVHNIGPGESDHNWCGFVMASSGLNQANVLVRAYKYFDPDYIGFWDSTYGNPRFSSNCDACFGFWDGAIHMWIFSNKFRIIVVAKSDTYYSFAYVGRFIPFALPQEYAYPLAVFGDLYCNISGLSLVIWYSSTDSYRHYFANAYFSSNYNNCIVNWTNSWTRSVSISPTQTDTDNWYTVAYMGDFPRVLFPLYLLSGGYTCGMFYGAYWSPGFALASESTITVGDDTYIIFQDVWRTGWADYIAIKCE